MRSSRLRPGILISIMVMAGYLLSAGAEPEPPGMALAPDVGNRMEAGNSTYKLGRTSSWVGAAMLPVGLVAAIPVWYDGAFGITAADPGFALFFVFAGAGLIHLGIPMMGYGSEEMESAARFPDAGFPRRAGTGWAWYRQSWMFLGGGALALAAAAPFAIIGALRGSPEDSPLGYAVAGLGLTGMGLMSVGAIEQYVSWYHFSASRRNVLASAHSRFGVSLQPMLYRSRDARPGLGLRLAGRF